MKILFKFGHDMPNNIQYSGYPVKNQAKLGLTFVANVLKVSFFLATHLQVALDPI